MDSGKLTIFGSGAMDDYEFVEIDTMTIGSNSPWRSYGNSIKSVEIQSGITHIGSCSFGAPDPTFWCPYVFRFSQLTSVSIPDTVTSIGNSAFRVSGLTSLEIPESIISINGGAFAICDNLTSVIIPDSVTIVGANAFNSCSSLSYLSIGKGVEGVRDTSFSGCPKLTSLALNNDHMVHNFRTCFPNYADITNIILGEGITKIEKDTFMGCSSLESISVPSTVTSIEEYAFSFCTALKEFKYNGTKDPSDSVIFNGCDNLKTVKVSAAYEDTEFRGLPIIYTGLCGTKLTWALDPQKFELIISGTGPMADYSSTSFAPWNPRRSFIKSIQIDKGVSSIGKQAFIDSESLTSVSIPASVTSVGAKAFYNCPELISLSYTGFNDLTTDADVFELCDKLEAVNVPTTYADEVFCTKPVTIVKQLKKRAEDSRIEKSVRYG